MPNTDTAFLCWMATKTPWRETWKDRGSPVSALICLPMSSSRDDGSGPNAPEVSIVKGAKWWLALMWAYFSVFCHSAWFVTAPASLAARATQMWKGIGIWACCMPCQGLTTLPRHHRCPTCPFPIHTWGAWGVQMWRYFGWCQCPPDHFVDCCMPQVSTLAHPVALCCVCENWK